MSLLVGVDLGTTETKAGLFDLDGNLLRLARSGYPIISCDEPGCAEQDPLVKIERSGTTDANRAQTTAVDTCVLKGLVDRVGNPR